MKLAADGGHCGGVVVVSVGEEYAHGLQVVFCNVVKNAAGLRAGIDNGAAEALLVDDDVAVGGELTDFKGFYEHGFVPP